MLGHKICGVTSELVRLLTNSDELQMNILRTEQLARTKGRLPVDYTTYDRVCMSASLLVGIFCSDMSKLKPFIQQLHNLAGTVRGQSTEIQTWKL